MVYLEVAEVILVLLKKTSKLIVMLRVVLMERTFNNCHEYVNVLEKDKIIGMNIFLNFKNLKSDMEMQVNLVILKKEELIMVVAVVEEVL